MKVAWVPLGDFFEQIRVAEYVRPDRSYKMLGMKSHGRGPFASGVLNGSDTAYKKLHPVAHNQVVYPKLMAWEGAFGVVTKELDQTWVTPEFVVFSVNEAMASVAYVRHLLTWTGFLSLVKDASPGTNVRRRRLLPTAFLQISVPLPSLADQERIARHLGKVENTIPAKRSGPGDAADSAISGWLDSLPRVRLRDLAEISPRRTAPDSSKINFVAMAGLDAVTGTASPRLMERAELKSGYRRFEDGDVLFARITPCMQNGKSAIYRSADNLTGYGSTEFHVLRPKDQTVAEWIWLVLRTDWFISRAKEAFKGTAGQQRVPVEFLRTVEIPVPSSQDLPAAIARLARLRGLLNKANELRRAGVALQAAILPAARNAIFNAMR